MHLKCNYGISKCLKIFNILQTRKKHRPIDDNQKVSAVRKFRFFLLPHFPLNYAYEPKMQLQ